MTRETVGSKTIMDPTTTRILTRMSLVLLAGVAGFTAGACLAQAVRWFDAPTGFGIFRKDGGWIPFRAVVFFAALGLLMALAGLAWQWALGH